MKDRRALGTFAVYISIVIPVIVWAILAKCTDWTIIFIPVGGALLFIILGFSKNLDLFPNMDPDAEIVFDESDPTDVKIIFDTLDLDAADEKGYALYKIVHTSEPYKNCSKKSSRN